MTEQEAKAFVERLTRIWTPKGGFIKRATWHLKYAASLIDAIDIEIVWLRGHGYFLLFLSIGEEHFLSCHEKDGYISDDWSKTKEQYARFKPLVDLWLPLFRRGCWLSGLPIEASVHEKAEWMQGFSREELDAWNLKF